MITCLYCNNQIPEEHLYPPNVPKNPEVCDTCKEPNYPSKLEREQIFLNDKDTLTMLRDKIKELNNELFSLEDSLKKELLKGYTNKTPEQEWIIQYLKDKISLLEKKISSLKYKTRPKSAQKKGFNVEIIKSIPIENIIGSPDKINGYRHYYKCPLHEENTPSFMVDVKNNRWHCFGLCSSGGDVISLYMKLKNIDFITACKELS